VINFARAPANYRPQRAAADVTSPIRSPLRRSKAVTAAQERRSRVKIDCRVYLTPRTTCVSNWSIPAAC